MGSGAATGAAAFTEGVAGDTELGLVIAAWPTLPDAIRQAMLVMIAANNGKGREQ